MATRDPKAMRRMKTAAQTPMISLMPPSSVTEPGKAPDAAGVDAGPNFLRAHGHVLVTGINGIRRSGSLFRDRL
jgi:hypothetical protein